LGCVLPLLLCGGLAFLTWHYFGRPRSAEETANRFFRLLAEEDVNGAFAQAAPQMQKGRSPSMLLLEARRWGLSSSSRLSWSEIKEAESEATLTGTLVNKDGPDFLLLVKLVRVGNSWRVLSVGPAPRRTSPETSAESEEREIVPDKP
jgi:hypothetical protein